jgi:hypothetical protein
MFCHTAAAMPCDRRRHPYRNRHADILATPTDKSAFVAMTWVHDSFVGDDLARCRCQRV